MPHAERDEARTWPFSSTRSMFSSQIRGNRAGRSTAVVPVPTDGSGALSVDDEARESPGGRVPERPAHRAFALGQQVSGDAPRAEQGEDPPHGEAREIGGKEHRFGPGGAGEGMKALEEAGVLRRQPADRVRGIQRHVGQGRGEQRGDARFESCLGIGLGAHDGRGPRFQRAHRVEAQLAGSPREPGLHGLRLLREDGWNGHREDEPQDRNRTPDHGPSTFSRGARAGAPAAGFPPGGVRADTRVGLRQKLQRDPVRLADRPQGVPLPHDMHPELHQGNGVPCQGLFDRLPVLRRHLQLVAVGSRRRDPEQQLGIAGRERLPGDARCLREQAKVDRARHGDPFPRDRGIPGNLEAVPAGLVQDPAQRRELRHERRGLRRQHPLRPQGPVVRGAVVLHETGHPARPCVVGGEGHFPAAELPVALLHLRERRLGRAEEIPTLVDPLVHAQAVRRRGVPHQLPEPRRPLRGDRTGLVPAFDRGQELQLPRQAPLGDLAR